MFTPTYKRTRERGYAWELHYGNIVTLSCISAEKCPEQHLRKLRKSGYSIDKILDNIELTGGRNERNKRTCTA